MKLDHELGGIEILRFLCALGVLIWHYQHFLFLGGWDPDLSVVIRTSLPLYHELAFFYDNGSLAVPFFWTISGFIFYWHYASSISERQVGFSDFVIRRFSRLYPLHFLTLLVVATGQYLYYRLHQTTFIYLWNKPVWFLAHLSFASNWLTRQPVTFNGPIWSVSIELLVYLTFFAVARASNVRAPMAAIMSGTFALCFGLINSFINPEVFACGMYFFAGGLAQRLSLHRAAFPLSCLLCTGTIIALMISKRGINHFELLLLATSTVIIFTKLGEGILFSPFRYVAFLGNATYSSYLLHFPLQLIAVIVMDQTGLDRRLFLSPIAFLGFIALVIGLSLIVYRSFEVPAQSWFRAASRSWLQARLTSRRLTDG
jgi:peptidoglycan/LPS O-acetylase OafA/YrhL